MAIAVAGHGLVDEPHPVAVEDLSAGVVGVDDHEPGAVELEVPLEQRQRAAADRPKADHHDGAVDPAVDWPSGHANTPGESAKKAGSGRILPDSPSAVHALPSQAACPEW